MKLPTVLEQLALVSQLSVAAVHSFTSTQVGEDDAVPLLQVICAVPEILYPLLSQVTVFGFP